MREAAGGRRVGRIVEVEAYAGPDDRASHARFGRTQRTASMFARAGTAYVYLVYGMHDCLNVVAGAEGSPSAILVRAVEPVEGLEAMRRARLERLVARRRGPVDDAHVTRQAGRLGRVPAHRLASGPALVSAAFAIDRSHDGVDLLDPGSSLRLEAGAVRSTERITASPRIGVAYAGEPWAGRAWRFTIEGHPSLCRPSRR